MKISPSNENDHPQPGGLHYKDSVQSEQSLMQQSSLGVTQSQAQDNIGNENPNATHADHHIEQTPVTQYQADHSATEANKLNKNEDHLMSEGRKSMGIENCQDFEEDDAPIPAAQIAERYESMEKTAKKKKPAIIEDEGDSPPLLPWQIGCEDEDLATKKSYVNIIRSSL